MQLRVKFIKGKNKFKSLRFSEILNLEYNLLESDDRNELRKDLLIIQESKCAICEKILALENSYLDHCHETNRIRGVLCRNCNQGIGLFRDDKNLLIKAIRYLTSKYTDFVQEII